MRYFEVAATSGAPLAGSGARVTAMTDKSQEPPMIRPRKTRALRKVAALTVALFWSAGLFAAKDMTKEYLACVGKAGEGDGQNT